MRFLLLTLGYREVSVGYACQSSIDTMESRGRLEKKLLSEPAEIKDD